MLQGDNLPISSFCSLVLVSDLQCHILAKKSNRESMIKFWNSTSLIAGIILTVPIPSISDLPILPYKIISCMDFILPEIGKIAVFAMIWTKV